MTMARSRKFGGVTTAVGSDAVLFVGTASPGVVTVATFVTDGTAAADTETVSEMTNEPPGGSTPELLQLTTAPAAEQVQPGAAAETKFNPLGRLSTTVIGPMVDTFPTFDTVSV